jgi:Do/DeqQ family serine protease
MSTRLASLNGLGETPMSNFVEASKKSVECVVHIKSSIVEEKIGYNYKQYVDPLEQFFNGWNAPRYWQKEPQKMQQVQQATGSGVIITSDGYIVTNNHVVDNANEVEVTLNDNRTYKAKVVGTDPSTDIALLKIDESSLPSITFANSDNVNIGEWVLAVGNPFNLASTVTAGIVSAKARNINILQTESAIESFIQTDAAVNPGNSGGALVNLNGDLIGINTAIATPTGTYAGYSFAVPANIVKKVVDDLINYGAIQRAFMGAEISDLTSESAKELNIPFSEGVIVQKVLTESAAQEGGMKDKDIIVKINGHKIVQRSQLLEQIGQHRPGDKVEVTVFRNNKEENLSLVLRNNQGKTALVKKDAGSLKEMLGAEFKDLSDKDKQNLDIDCGVQVVNIGQGKVAKETNIQKGFIILKVDDKPVKTTDDLIKILQSKKGGVMLEGIYPNNFGTYYYALGL